MNYKKKGLRKLINMILSGQVSDTVLTHKDRLLRFGSELIFLICKFFGIRVHIIHEDKNLLVPCLMNALTTGVSHLWW